MHFLTHTKRSFLKVGLAATLACSIFVPIASAKNVAIQAGPIWNQQDANVKCKRLARSVKGVWTGHWWTTQQGKMSVCSIKIGGVKKAIQAGPIWSQKDAKVKCPRLARSVNGKWTGHWWTTQQGKMSVCQILF